MTLIYAPGHLTTEGWREIPLWALNRGVQVPTPGSLTDSAIALGTMLKWFSQAEEDTICFAVQEGCSSEEERGSLKPEVAGSCPVAPATLKCGTCDGQYGDGVCRCWSYTRWWYDKWGQLYRTIIDRDGVYDISYDLATRRRRN